MIAQQLSRATRRSMKVFGVAMLTILAYAFVAAIVMGAVRQDRSFGIDEFARETADDAVVPGVARYELRRSIPYGD